MEMSRDYHLGLSTRREELYYLTWDNFTPSPETLTVKKICGPSSVGERCWVEWWRWPEASDKYFNQINFSFPSHTLLCYYHVIVFLHLASPRRWWHPFSNQPAIRPKDKRQEDDEEFPLFSWRLFHFHLPKSYRKTLCRWWIFIIRKFTFYFYANFPSYCRCLPHLHHCVIVDDNRTLHKLGWNFPRSRCFTLTENGPISLHCFVIIWRDLSSSPQLLTIIRRKLSS